MPNSENIIDLHSSPPHALATNLSLPHHELSFSVRYAAFLELLLKDWPQNSSDGERLIQEGSDLGSAKLDSEVSAEHSLVDIIDKLSVIHHLNEIGLEIGICLQDLMAQIAYRIRRQ